MDSDEGTQMNRTTRMLVAGVAAAVLALGGCTGSSDEPEPSTQATAQDEWAHALCEALRPTTAEVQTPSGEAQDPAEAKQEIVTFLQTLRDRLREQGKVLADAGAPPEVGAESYESAKEALDTSAATLTSIIKRFKKADASSAEQMEASLMQLSESLAGPSSYQGPLADLSEGDPALKKAFENSDTCVALMS